MLDLKFVRENPDEVIRRLEHRAAAELVTDLLKIDAMHRSTIGELQEAQSRRNAVSATIGHLSAKREPTDDLKAEMKALKAKIDKLVAQEFGLAEAVSERMLTLPNMIADGVPAGPDDTCNRVVRIEGMRPRFGFAPKEHFDLGEQLGLDFQTGARISGSRFTVLRGNLARLERALGQFMLDQHVKEHGYTEVSVPLLVNKEAMVGTGQLPKFEEDLFKTTDGRYLIPTAEVSITNMFRESIWDEDDLGRFCALTPCFRAEAGSAGRDTRGMIRQHQFYKVEMVSITTDEQSGHDEHEIMLQAAENILKALGLPYRIVLLSAGDTGFSSRKTYDLEVWLPGQQAYREISSVSYFGDFQGRRMNARYRPVKGQRGTKFVHTCNGSGLAVGRTLVAILENYQNEDGSVTIPEALHSYTGFTALHP